MNLSLSDDLVNDLVNRFIKMEWNFETNEEDVVRIREILRSIEMRDQIITSIRPHLLEMTGDELLEYANVLETLNENLEKVIHAIPECPLHGNRCIPHALEWIEDHKAKE